MKLSFVTIAMLCAVLTGLVWQSDGLADESTKVSESAKVGDRKASDLLGKMCKFYLGASSLSCHVVADEQLKKGEAAQKVKTICDLKVLKPASMALDVSKNGSADKLIARLNKSEIYVDLPGKGYLKRSASSMPVGERLTNYMTMSTSKQLALFGLLAVLIDKDPWSLLSQQLSGHLDAVKSLGDEKIDGAAYAHIQLLSLSNLKWEVWVDKGDKPWVRRAQAHINNPKEKVELDITTNYGAWQRDVKFSDQTFVYVPRPGEKPVQAEEPPDVEAKLKNKAAPAIKLSTVSGGTFNLADSKGNSVVVLDFWATWCPPCREALPILSKVTAAYAKKGVRFCAIDMQEDPAKVREYLKKQGLSITAAVDTDKAVAKSYGVTGIPQSVIIGKDGLVKVVHVGFSPALEEELPKELDAALKGK